MPRGRILIEASPDPDAAEARVLRFQREDVFLERRLQRQLQLLEPEDSALSASCNDSRHSSSLAGCALQPGTRPAGLEANLSALLGPADAACERAPTPAPWGPGARTPSPPIAIPGSELGFWRAPRARRAQRASGESALARAPSSDALYELEK
jgi:hypothetical protein